MTWWKAKSPEPVEQLARRLRLSRGVLAGLLVSGLSACGPPPVVASPRGMSYGVEHAGRPFNAATLVEGARGTRRTAHDVLFEGSAIAPTGEGIDGAVIVFGLPRGDGVTLVDREGLVRDGQLVVVEALVAELRRRGMDARLDRETTQALPPRGVPVAQRVSIWLDDILIHRTPDHVEASTRMHIWVRSAEGEARWDEARPLRTREDRAPFDVLGALGREAAARLAQRLAPPVARAAMEPSNQ